MQHNARARLDEACQHQWLGEVRRLDDPARPSCHAMPQIGFS